MLLYRIVHHEIAYRLRNFPEEGNLLLFKIPYFIAFDSLAAAIVESLIYRECHGIPSSFRVVEYTVGDGFSSKTIITEPIMALTKGNLEYELSESARSFLISEVAVIGSFPSTKWKNICNYLINMNHPNSTNIHLSRIYSCT